LCILINNKKTSGKMSLETRVMQALKEAMKAKDEAAKRGLRAIKSAILLEKTSGSGKALDEVGEIKMLQKLVKQRRDSLAIFEQQGREDLAEKEREEIEVIERFLPIQMDEAELEALIKGVIDQVGATSMRDMGKVMGLATKQLAGRADGKTVSGMVKKLLA
jgi:uncharacterized protein YqeY